MKKSLLLAVVFASFGLGGCVAYDPYYGAYGPAYVAPPAIVVGPAYYGYYHGGRRYYR